MVMTVTYWFNRDMTLAFNHYRLGPIYFINEQMAVKAHWASCYIYSEIVTNRRKSFTFNYIDFKGGYSKH